MKESLIRKEIRDWLDTQGVFCWPNLTVGIPDGQGAYRKHPMPGIADICGVLPNGRALAIEVKKPGSHTDKERLIAQMKFISRVNVCGGIGFFAYSLDMVKAQIEPKLKDIDCKRAKMWFVETAETLRRVHLPCDDY
jgi:hypothetical protein